MERRALEAAFAGLAETSGVDQLVERARAIAAHGNAALPVLVSMLDTSDPQLRGGLGQVATQLDAELVVPALRGVARSRDRSDQARLTALMILERFLHESVDESLLSDLQDPDTVALQSLRELSHEMERNPFVVIEYLNQLAEQPSDVTRTVLSAIPQVPGGPHIVTLLRMLAQGVDAELAQAALEQLSRTRSQDAARALFCLASSLPPARAALAERSLRKLRLSGVAEPVRGDVPGDSSFAAWPHVQEIPAGWRALMSPVDGSGAQVVWFVSQADPAGQAILFSILCKDPGGIVASFGSFEVSASDLPPARSRGSLHTIQQADDTPPIVLLEVSFETGRQAVREALALNWLADQAPPMEYRLLNPLIWLETAGQAEEVGKAGQTDAPAAGACPSAVLDHPAFASWFWQAPQLYEAAEELGRRPARAAREAAIAGMAAGSFGPAGAEVYGRRLSRMARWLALASEHEAAALAAAGARQLAERLPSESAFVRRLIGIGLDVAVANLRSGFDLRKLSAGLG